jgi:nitrogen regulatory protein PII-like uncharacterized protein
MAGGVVDPPRQPTKEEVLEPTSTGTTPELGQEAPKAEPTDAKSTKEEDLSSSIPGGFDSSEKKVDIPSAVSEDKVESIPESSEKQVDISSAVSGDNVEAVSESLTSSADGKRLSDGDETVSASRD